MSTQTADELAPETIDQDEAAQLRSPLERFGLSGKALEYGNWIAVAVGIYILITAVNVIGDGFKSATGGQAEELFAFAENPLIALMIGVLATGLIQSSSTTTSTTVPATAVAAVVTDPTYTG